jgi:hypothetical protein
MVEIPRLQAKRRLVMPAKAGIHLRAPCKAKKTLDSGLRRNDDKGKSTSSQRIQNPSALSRGSFKGGATMSHRSPNQLTPAVVLRTVGALILLACITVGNAQGADLGMGQPDSVPAVKAQQTDLRLVSHSPLIARGQTLGTVVIFDNPETRRPADYLELYDIAGGLVAIVWFDRFGIQRTVVDRALVEGGDELEGVLVAVVEGEPI